MDNFRDPRLYKDEFQTPNLDRLAQSGMVFTQCHARPCVFKTDRIIVCVLRRIRS